MMHEQFDALVRRLSGGATRRGVLGALVGIAVLPVTEVDAQRRQRAKRRQRAARRERRGLSAQQNRARRTPAITIRQGCPDQPAQEILLLGAIGYHNSYWWDHTNLTVAVQAHPRANPDLIAATREAISIWSRVLAADPVLSQADVTLTDVTDTIGPAQGRHHAPLRTAGRGRRL